MLQLLYRTELSSAFLMLRLSREKSVCRMQFSFPHSIRKRLCISARAARYLSHVLEEQESVHGVLTDVLVAKSKLTVLQQWSFCLLAIGSVRPSSRGVVTSCGGVDLVRTTKESMSRGERYYYYE